MSDIGPPEVDHVVEEIHNEPDDDKARELERELLEETDKGDDEWPS